MTIFSRLMGVFFSPKDTFKHLSEKPVWADMLILLLICVTIYAAVIAPTIPNDQIKLLESDAERRAEMGEEAFNRRLEFWKDPPPFVTITGIIMQPVSLLVGFLIQSLVILGLGRLISMEGKYIQVFSSFVHASAINLVLGNAVRAFLVISRESVFQTSTSMAIFFPRLEIMSPAYIVLTQVDFFLLWLLGIFGFALAEIFKIGWKKALFLSYGFWLLRSLFFIVLGLLGMKLGS